MAGGWQVQCADVTVRIVRESYANVVSVQCPRCEGGMRGTRVPLLGISVPHHCL